MKEIETKLMQNNQTDKEITQNKKLTGEAKDVEQTMRFRRSREKTF